MTNELKAELRRDMKAIREQLGDRDAKNCCIFENLISSEFYKNARSVLSYCSVGTEVDTVRINSHSYDNGKITALPVTGDGGKLSFYEYAAGDSLIRGAYGIPEPAKKRHAAAEVFDLCLLPALSCDLKGYRLGYGKGCYDRFLPCFKGLKVILVFSDCLAETIFPDSWDVKADYAVSDRGIIKF